VQRCHRHGRGRRALRYTVNADHCCTGQMKAMSNPNPTPPVNAIAAQLAKRSLPTGNHLAHHPHDYGAHTGVCPGRRVEAANLAACSFLLMAAASAGGIFSPTWCELVVSDDGPCRSTGPAAVETTPARHRIRRILHPPPRHSAEADPIIAERIVAYAERHYCEMTITGRPNVIVEQGVGHPGAAEYQDPTLPKGMPSLPTTPTTYTYGVQSTEAVNKVREVMQS